MDTSGHSEGAKLKPVISPMRFHGYAPIRRYAIKHSGGAKGVGA